MLSIARVLANAPARLLRIIRMKTSVAQREVRPFTSCLGAASTKDRLETDKETQ